MLGKWRKTAKKLPKDGEKLPQVLFKHLKYALLLNNNIKAFQKITQSQKKAKNAKNSQNTGKIEKK